MLRADIWHYKNHLHRREQVSGFLWPSASPHIHLCPLSNIAYLLRSSSEHLVTSWWPGLNIAWTTQQLLRGVNSFASCRCCGTKKAGFLQTCLLILLKISLHTIMSHSTALSGPYSYAFIHKNFFTITTQRIHCMHQDDLLRFANADLKQQAPQHAPPQVVNHHVEPGPEPGALSQPPRKPAVHSCTHNITQWRVSCGWISQRLLLLQRVIFCNF